MPRKKPNIARQAKEEARAECEHLRHHTAAALLCHTHGHSLISEVLTWNDRRQLEEHYLKILFDDWPRKAQENKVAELAKDIDTIHPSYLPVFIDRLTPMNIEPCSDNEDEPMTGH